MKQTAKILAPTRESKNMYLVHFFRDGQVMMKLRFWSRSDADQVAEWWRQGQGMGAIAERMKRSSMTISH